MTKLEKHRQELIKENKTLNNLLEIERQQVKRLAEQLNLCGVSKSFYCNNSENDYKDTICKEQCTICKWQAEAKQ